MNDQNNALSDETGWNELPGEIETELNGIMHYWEQYTVDVKGTGFVGRIDQNNQVDELAPKGVVLNTRILWAFSAVHRQSQNPLHLQLAVRAFRYICEYFTDHEHGGLYWSVDHEGKMLENHKQIYAQAFGIYALSEYYRVSRDPNALEQAKDLFRLIEKYSLDQEQGGYIDSFARDWSFLEDKRLSAKDENASKTMNTHLHLVEAYANLYEVWPSPELKKRVVDLLHIFNEKIINKSSHHLTLFFSDDWLPDESIISYGHDIEAAWLLLYCAESIQDADAINKARKNALLITDAAMEGLADDGGLWYEYNIKNSELIQEKHWWPQAEALIGFCNAWQLTGNELYKNALLKIWQFIKNHILDKSNGEWFWGIDNKEKIMSAQDKVGMWKGPYHNSRACLELLKRLKTSMGVWEYGSMRV
jgi:cellobiose epimerase